ncbi:SMI1/KNR4 family protein [Jeotgalibacillus proteolyticus]|uniref:SMI1/KNR4 family protein n=1 Tax=Jeotgalibacillus proteolyticus TaxID=2082395 RepID=UPI003CF3EED6
MQWKYCKKEIDDSAIEAVEKEFSIQYPASYKKLVLECHGGRPSKNIFDTETEKEKMLKSFLPLTEIESMQSVSSASKIVNQLNEHVKLIPFADEPGGDFVCFKYGGGNEQPSIVVYSQERQKEEKISNDFTEFIDHLYELTD